MNQYIELSGIYDKMIDIDYDKWIFFVESYFENKGMSLKQKNVLELGCGTGNMTLRLKERGADVTALDLSSDMLSIAQEKLRLKRYKINFINQDMRDFNINKKYDYVFSFCDGYNYIIEENDIIESFKRVYNHLSSYGYFMFDISTPYKLKNIIGNNTFTLNEDNLCYIWDNYLEDDIIEMYITFFVKEENLYKRFDENHIQRAHDLGKIKEYLYIAKFKDIEIYDDYNLTNIKDKSMRAVFIAKKEE
ncbi:Methyltransferase domain-containing protein [Caloramator quimbayensis]|uniref:Methyltransferase domain-containing protein n=1 Tax=Caloramator quimbayensis TaxID=1147123 RepID=A0A1T4XHW7_9CLOT|nr:class I SAM-dependent methyltransferase [Caloramator quimbayensis]SKA89140.1 Methyltransferase domain-containing protein [Caloramator quimbayensis]